MTYRRALAALIAIAIAGAAAAQEHRVGTLEIDQPWARATPPAAKTGAVYMEIRNTGAEPDRLVEIRSPVADRAEVHQTESESGIVRMRHVPALEIKPDGSALLRPGDIHIMLNGLKGPLQAGTEFPLTLQFERAGPVEIDVRVERSAPAHGPATAPSSHGH